MLRKELERDIIRVTTIVPGGFVSELGRGFPPAIMATLGEKIERLQVPFDQVLSNPVHIANLVAYILDQPTEVNLSEVVIRPPVSLEY